MLFILVISLAFIGLGLCLFVLYEFNKMRIRSSRKLTGKHVLITGGSSGIGKAIALEVLKRGANVSIFARNQSKLEETKEELSKCLVDPSQKIFIYSVDISKNYSIVDSAVQQAIENLGIVALLVNCAGTSVSHRFEETPIEEFQRMLDVNYIGTVYVTKAVLPYMKKAKKGNIVVVSSLAGLFGLYGFTAYSPSKFALVGFAEALQMEVKPFNISVTVSFPPDTDTPGFEEEQKSKPLETMKISESGGLCSAQQVGTQIVKDALMRKFISVVGSEGLMLSTLCAGIMPASSVFEAVFQVLTMGIFRIVGIVFLRNCNRIIMQCSLKKEEIKKEN